VLSPRSNRSRQRTNETPTVSYVSNNPLNSIDPDGLAPRSWVFQYPINIVGGGGGGRGGGSSAGGGVLRGSTYGGGGGVNVKTPVTKKADLLRQGKDVHVKDVNEAREILRCMPELQPGPGNVMPGLRDRRNTYRGDLINKTDPSSPKIHDRGKHANQPHYNIDIRDQYNVRHRPAIFIDD
jgi:hypothetical protein